MEELKITLAAARVNAGLTQEEMAKKLNVSKQTIINWEKGRIKNEIMVVNEYCRICNVPSTDYIFLPR